LAEDVLSALGHLALGSRLKRVGERLQSETQAILSDAGLDFPAAQFPILAALDRLGPLSIGELAAALGVAQPGVTRMIGKIEAEGLVRTRAGPDDRRIRIVSLTPSGRRLVDRAKRTAWPLIEAAVADACLGLSGPLLVQIAGLEDALAARPLPQRANARRGRYS